jgi:5-methylcytosine-specific restriction endonuclease McrA
MAGIKKNRKRKGPARNCVVCGKSFAPYNTLQISCSQECHRQEYLVRKGKNKTLTEWNNLREFIMERDNFTCQDCSVFSMSIGLDVHHIIPLHKGGKNEEKNLITLCHKCHKKRHSL